MMFKLRSVFLLIFFCSSFFAKAQSVSFENFTTKDGLLSDEVYKIFQDKKGYIWLFTNYGVMKYNGKKFVQILKNLPFNESFVYSYFERNDGRVWIANSNGRIYEVISDTAAFINGTEEIAQKLKKNVSEIVDLLVDKNENIYINTKIGGFKLESKKGYKESLFLNYLNEDSVFVHLADIDGQIFPSINFALKKHLNFHKAETHRIKYINTSNPNDTYIIRFTGSGTHNPNNFRRFDDVIYFSHYDRLYKVNKDKSVKAILLNAPILNYTRDKNGHLWVGTYSHGLYEVNENDSIINNYFEGKTINHVLFDSQNGLWVSSDGSGLFHCKGLNEMHYKESEFFGAPINFMKRIGSKLFLANGSGGIYMIDGNKIETIKREVENAEVLDIIKYKNGFIICYRFKMEFIELTKPVKINLLPNIKPAFYPVKLYNFSGDSILCIARKSILMLNYGIESFENEKENNIKSIDHKSFMLAKRGNNYLVGTEDGLFELVNYRLVQPDYLLPIKDYRVTKIVIDKLNNYWFCTKGNGLYKLTNKNELIHYTTDKDLPGNIINDVSFNSDNNMLLSTSKGLYYESNSSYDLKKWIEIYPEQVKSAIAFDNNIYIITKDGLVIFKDEKKREQQSIYFNLASISVNDQKINFNKLVDLNYKENNLDFAFDVISFSTNVPNIRYKLNGPVNYSGIETNQHLSFQNLPPGHYKLFAAALSKSIKIKPISISFTIEPALWQRLWFIVFCCLLMLVLFIYLGWLFYRYRKVKEDRKNEANRLITEYKLIALKAQINPHFMSNCLTAIQHLIINEKLDEANQYIAKFSLLVRQVLNFSSKALVTLQEELQITELNIELEQLRFENKFLFEIEVNESISLGSLLIPPLILQPIVENAIWHGLLPLKSFRKGKLLIKVTESDGFITIVVEDNGIGRPIKSKEISNLRTSKGMEITKQRIFNFNNFYDNNKADLIYEDLLDDLNNSIGTRVLIILPLITSIHND